MRPPERLAWPMFGAVASTAPPPAISPSAASAAVGPAPQFAPNAATSSPRRRSAASRAVTACERLGVLVVEGEERDDRQRGDRADRLDRGHELVEIGEGLDREQVDAAAVQEPRLLGEHLRVVGAALGQRPDRARDEDVLARDLARVARALHARADDRLELVLEVEPGQLAPVRAEGVRLDQLGAGPDEAQVRGDDALGRADVRLLGTAQARHCAREQGAHAAVADDHGPARQPLQEAAHPPRLAAGKSTAAVNRVRVMDQPATHPRYLGHTESGPRCGGGPLGYS